jgi:hypothetical protein
MENEGTNLWFSVRFILLPLPSVTQLLKLGEPELNPTSLYGDEVHARITGGLSDCDESVRRKILWDNAQKLYKVEGPTAKDEAQRTAAANA